MKPPGSGRKGGEAIMTDQDIKHVEKQLISFIDRVAAEKEKATPAEIAALPEEAFALARIHEL